MPYTIGDARRDAAARIAAISETAFLDTDWLLGTILDQDRATLLAHLDSPMPPDVLARFDEWVARAEAGEPIAYILGRRGFYDLEFEVTPAVLIPRPETELLLEEALKWADANTDKIAHLHAADIGTGSGALGITFGAHAPRWHVSAVDVSASALAVAARNRARIDTDTLNLAERIRFHKGDLLAPLIAAIETGTLPRIDLLMANLPYIPHAVLDDLAVAQWEPRLALDGGDDGLSLVRRLLTDAPRVLADQALILLEIGSGQGDAALEAVRAHLPADGVRDARILKDYAFHDRIARVEWAM